MTKLEAIEILYRIIELEHDIPVPDRDFIVEAVQIAIESLKKQEQFDSHTDIDIDRYGVCRRKNVRRWNAEEQR